MNQDLTSPTFLEEAATLGLDSAERPSSPHAAAHPVKRRFSGEYVRWPTSMTVFAPRSTQSCSQMREQEYDDLTPAEQRLGANALFLAMARWRAARVL